MPHVWTLYDFPRVLVSFALVLMIFLLQDLIAIQRYLRTKPPLLRKKKVTIIKSPESISNCSRNKSVFPNLGLILYSLQVY